MKLFPQRVLKVVCRMRNNRLKKVSIKSSKPIVFFYFFSIFVVIGQYPLSDFYHEHAIAGMSRLN